MLDLLMDRVRVPLILGKVLDVPRDQAEALLTLFHRHGRCLLLRQRSGASPNDRPCASELIGQGRQHLNCFRQALPGQTGQHLLGRDRR